INVRNPTEASERVKKILFVCTANICRSPMAAAMFNALAEDGALPFRAESEAMIEEAELVLAMTPQHAATLRRLGGEPPRGIHTLPEYATGAAGVGIPDPYGLTIAAYRNTLRQLYEYVEHVGDRLEG